MTPAPSPLIGVDGSFSTAVFVPFIGLGNKQVSVVAQDDHTVTQFIRLTEASAMVLTDPADVFADLIEAGTLSRVWHLNAALQTSDPGSAWTFYDPNPDLADFNKLTEIQSGQTYVLIMTAEGEFNGKALYSGTNFVFIPLGP